MLSGISMTCFAASYSVALALEISRLFLRVSVRTALSIGFAAAGLLAHTLYLYVQVQAEWAGGSPLASWYHWCLMVAWVLAAAYVGLALAHPKTTVGLFMLPTVLVLVGVSYPFREAPPFPDRTGAAVWTPIHVVALLLGAAVVVLGFVAGVMYLVQSYRLKHKLPPRQGLRLPSLEWLERINSRSTIVSACLFAAGVLAGILMNVSRGTVPWTDPVVYATGPLLAWLLIASVVELFYRPARQGRKVAYMTVASFVFLGLVLAVTLLVGHGGERGKGVQSSGFRVQDSAPLAASQGGVIPPESRAPSPEPRAPMPQRGGGR